MTKTHRLAGRPVVLIDQTVAEAIVDADCWGYDFRVIEQTGATTDGRFERYDDNFDAAAPIAIVAVDRDVDLPGPMALSATAAATWAAGRRDRVADLVRMMVARDANVATNADAFPPLVLLVRPAFLESDIVHQLASLGAQQRQALDIWTESLMREKVSLKIENEELHETLSDFQSVLWRIEDSRSLAYEVACGDNAIALEQDILIQTLPISTRGLTDVELHLAEKPVRPLTLRLDLLQVETNEILHRWTRSHPDLSAGWNRFSLPIALMGPRLGGALHVARDDGDAPMRLSLANPTANEKARARLGAETQPSPLAFRLWQALPGALNRDPVTGRVGGGWRMLTRSEMTAMALAPGFGRELSYPFEIFAVSYPELRLHPLMGKVLVARTPAPAEPDIVGMRARVSVPDHRAQPIDFRIAYAPTGSAREPDPSFSSEWTTVQPGREATLLVKFEDNLPMTGELSFAVRMARSAINHDYCGVRWRSIELLHRDSEDAIDGLSPGLARRLARKLARGLWR